MPANDVDAIDESGVGHDESEIRGGLSKRQWDLLHTLVDNAIGQHGRQVDDDLLELREDMPLGKDDIRWRRL